MNMRLSNIELGRIICMFLIIAHHACIHGGAVQHAMGFNQLLAVFLLPGGKMGFVTFVVISTWFLVDKNFKWDRFIKTWLQVLFYSVLFASVAVAFGAHLNLRNWLSIFFPIAGNSHGFAATYLAFYLMIPFLLIVARRLSVVQFKFLIAILFYYQIVSRMLAVIFDYHANILSSEVTLFVLLYFISYYLKNYTNVLSEGIGYYALRAIIVWLLVVGISLWNILVSSDVSKVFALLATDESSILYLWGGYLFFFVFMKMNVKYNFYVNKLATVSFGVLLFHDHNFFRPILWNNILHSIDFYSTVYFPIWIVGCAVGIYAFGAILDFGRQRGMMLIYNLQIYKKLIYRVEHNLVVTDNNEK